MRLDIFSEMQHPKEHWTGPDHEHRLIQETLEQARLADELGYGVWWQVEHHAAVEFSYSSAPEIMLTAIATSTKNLHVGHSSVLAPTRFNHPIRIAERSAFIDHLSGGRFQLGLARSTIPEWRTFNVEPDATRGQMQQSFELLPKLWTQDKVSWDSADIKLNNISVIPKPYRKPHPPLWQACSSPASFEQAGRNGVGALGVTLWASPEEVAEMIHIYREALRTRCEPVGEFVNDQVAFFTFVHCADSEREAMENGAAKAAAWYTAGSFTFFEAKDAFVKTAAELEALAKDPAGGGLTGQYVRNKNPNAPQSQAQRILGRIMSGENVPDEQVWEVLSGQDSLIVGTQDQVRKGLKRYEALGIDALMSFHQVGALTHDKVMKSIRLTGGLIPEFRTPAPP
ncbi:LLM class flavin-dependent oxidoreductase [Corallococcus praedator]|uniref:LLM class flavin-dependent oxidoreductase n=1 Tax=Corallococcus praedator TaxID=2316724 RepID=A0ABX9QTC5_9BACT|nr:MULTISPECIES: LLM class flavin-dependent oxidoreductase [Corallococcus]RKH20674.1 LLM class flavin-dependent oxidoreductase [Corallococcus sp. CA047B]RKH34887.1 LLM class flavin-dependent oxidoreductase [Corallococcus sp. CA031C]RKI16767.1 LLM class flavin-dependent oxidoreductase [Corallococcus praedator]